MSFDPGLLSTSAGEQEQDTLEEDNNRRSSTNMVKEVVGEGVEKLKRFRGKVFHVITGENTWLRLSVDSDGRLRRDKSFNSLQLQNLAQAPRRMLEAGKEAPKNARRQWRKVVTGDPDKRIRDHMKEVPQVKWIDKVSFTLGVMCICFSEWLALRHPEHFPIYYYTLMALLLINRYFSYAQDKYELFMLDFCYFLNLSVVAQTCLFPNNLIWFKANYVLAMGPLIFAIVVWHNSLVFHSCDKLTSFFLHSFPPLTLHLYRWGCIPSKIFENEDSLKLSEWLFYPLILYIVWQVGYIFVTGVLLSKKLKEDPDLITSVRYLTRDKKNPLKLLIVKILMQLNMMKKDDVLDPDDIKSKLIFAIVQLIYTALTILPAKFLYGSYTFSCFFIFLMFGWGTWNGASYYIEVFSERYKLKFTKMEEKSDKIEEEDDDTDDFQNALDDLDENDPLYKELLEEIFQAADGGSEEIFQGSEEDPFDVDKGETDSVKIYEETIEEREGAKEDDTVKMGAIGGDALKICEEIDVVPKLLEDAAMESSRSSKSSSESNGKSEGTNGSEQSWENVE